jgi:hypothetical protein
MAYDNSTDHDNDYEPEREGCPRNSHGEFDGVRCDPYLPCYYAAKYQRADAGCGCCYIHCRCEPAHLDDERPGDD